MPFVLSPVPDERSGLLNLLTLQQDAFAAIAHGLTDAQVRWAPSASEMSVAWLIHHVTVVQENWLLGATTAPEALTAEQNATVMGREREPRAEATLADLLAALTDVNERVREAVRTLDLDTPMPAPDAPWFPDETWSVRWVWLHLIQELARHAGHGDIIRESIDGATAFELVAAEEGIDVPYIERWEPSAESFTRGFSTVTLAADDVRAATRWWSDLLGVEPYHDTDAYAELEIGPHRHQLGILDRRFAGAGWGPAENAPGTTVPYLWVGSLEPALARLEGAGATVHQPVREVGGGYRTASVIDPFGNLVGVMERPGTAPSRG